MTAGGYNRKITSEQRHELLQVYLHMGLDISRALCVEYGVSPDYAAKRASDLGFCIRGPASIPNARRWFWTEEKRAQLTALAATGTIAADIAIALGTSPASVITFAGRNNIAVVRYSAEQQFIYDARKKDRDAHRHRNRAAEEAQQKRIAERQAAMARGDFTAAAVNAAFTKTSRAYRKLLRPIGELSKNALRAMIAEAAANTASLQIVEASA